MVQSSNDAIARDTLILFPGALGDFLCLLPALLTTAAQTNRPLTLVAKPGLAEIVAPGLVIPISIDRPEIADLFADGAPLKPATRALLAGFAVAHSWTGHGNPTFNTRLAALGERVSVHRFRPSAAGEHAVDYYARCLGVSAAEPERVRRALAYDQPWLAQFEALHQLEGRELIVIHPGSGSVTKNWTGYQALIDELRRESSERVVAVLLGPAEEEAGALPAADIVVRAANLPQVAALLRRAQLYIGNDSGVSHLAGAVGTLGVVLFAASDPATWAPRGGLRVLRAAASCEQCGTRIFCTHRLPVARALSAL